MVESHCKVTDCERPRKARGYCQGHYDRLRRRGDALATSARVSRDGDCSVDGCDSRIYCRGFCQLHYARSRRHGDPLIRGRKPLPVAERFWAQVDRRAEHECWPWTGTLNNRGYGNFMLKVDGRWTNARSHRVAYELAIGPIPEGLEIDHVRARGCTRRDCVNPAHLEPVTRQENVRRAEHATGAESWQGKKTHCPQGHAYDEANTAIYGNRRQCIACRTERNTKNAAKRKAERAAARRLGIAA